MDNAILKLFNKLTLELLNTEAMVHVFNTVWCMLFNTEAMVHVVQHWSMLFNTGACCSTLEVQFSDTVKVTKTWLTSINNVHHIYIHSYRHNHTCIHAGRYNALLRYGDR